jgi:hypothetical protein
MIATFIRLVRPPWARLAAALAVALCTVALFFWGGSAMGFRWDPFDLQSRRLARAQAQADRATADAVARTLEVEGERAQARRLQTHTDTLMAAERATSRAAAQTRTDHDLSTPLAPDRAARLRAHDGELCRLAPDLAGCPAAPGPTGGGDDPL